MRFSSAQPEQSTPKVYSVTELNQLIKATLENSITSVWVEGEISNYRRHSSGHIYFTLKDQSSEVRAVIWRSSAASLTFELSDGMRVLCFGRVSVYAVKGYYEFDVRHIEPRGLGAHYLAFEQLKKRLQEEGLFDPAHKKPLPRFPDTIAVVTSPHGAAVRDIIRTIHNRFPKVRILVYGVLVQGESAADSIARALDALNERDDISVIIIGRGGGSIEDLCAFNEEVVARAIYRSRIPVVSAVGHEVDYTISDFVADVRAPTPTGAGQLVVPDIREVEQNLGNLIRRCVVVLQHTLAQQREVLKAAAKSPIFADPFSFVHDLQRRIDDIWRHIRKDIVTILARKKERLNSLGGRLNNASPLAVLERGYSITTVVGKNEPLKDPQDAPSGTLIETRLAKGKLLSRVQSDINTTPSLFH